MLLALLLFGPRTSHDPYIFWFLVQERVGEEKVPEDMLVTSAILDRGSLHEVRKLGFWYFEKKV